MSGIDWKSRAEAAEEELYQTKLVVLGGEDAPGYAATATVANIVKSLAWIKDVANYDLNQSLAANPRTGAVWPRRGWQNMLVQ